MDLTPQDLEEFRQIWKQEYGEDITLEEAKRHGEDLLETLFMLATFSARTEKPPDTPNVRTTKDSNHKNPLHKRKHRPSTE